MERRNLLEHRFPNRQPSSCAFFLLSFSSPCPRVFYPLRLHCVYLRKLARPRAATFLCRQCGPVCNDYRSSSPLLGTVVPGKTQFAQFPLLSSYRRGERRGTTMRNRGTLEKRWRRPRLDDDFPSEQITSSRKFVNLLYRSIRGGFNVEERIVKCYARKIRIRNIFI